MDAAWGSLAQHRVADAIPLSGVGRTGTAGDYRERPMPVGAAILWTPIGRVAADPAYPVFITQRALDTVHEQLADLPEGASSLGFLVGGMYQAPDTRTPYIVVESTIHLPWSIGGDHLEAALRQGCTIAQEDVRRSGDQLLGWYHSHVAAAARLSAGDVEAHVACFGQPWHVALVVARGAALTGGVFRVPSGAAPNECLPFYELLEGDSLLPDGRTATHLTWANYHTHEIALPSRLASQSPEAGPPPLLFPDETDFETDALPAPARQRSLLAPVARVVRFGALGIVVGGALFGAYRVFASGPEGATGRAKAEPVSAAALRDRSDRFADTVAFAVAAFEIRLRLFDGRKMVCSDLARGLMDVEARWIAHNAARKAGAATLDSAGIARDRRLYADVGAAERGFARTRCPRP
jgi:proteasome lid subunit RPN8/RPN11